MTLIEKEENFIGSKQAESIWEMVPRQDMVGDQEKMLHFVVPYKNTPLN